METSESSESAMITRSKIKFLADFIRLAHKRLNSREDYFNFQRLQAEGVFQDIENILKVPIESFVIDFGCGNGGYTDYFGDKFTEVVGVDYFVEPEKKNAKITYISHDLLTFKTEKKADLIFCSSVIEHVKDREALIKNISDNLRAEGFLYLSFPPFLSFGGGHNVKPFHYLPEKLSIKMAKFAGLTKVDKKVTSYENLFGNFGLYRTHIHEVKNLLNANKFKQIACKTRFFPFNTANIPLFGELLTWHVEFYCQKK